jgi:hypothetical protein
MKLPHGELAVVDSNKLVGYCLNQHHPRGRNKARVFAAVGILAKDAAELQAALLNAARHQDAKLGIANVHGQRYTVDFDFVRVPRTVRIRSAWIVVDGDPLPRRTSCYVLKEEGLL